MVARVEMATATPQVARKPRSPKHSFVLNHRPFTIQPCFIAPVWPGETLKLGLLQARSVTDPVKHPLIGWWHEYYIFYVKLNDLTARDKVINMLMNPAEDMSSLATAASPYHYHNGKGINWTKMCLDRVTDEFFRNEGEGVYDYAIDDLPIASVNNDTWLDSARLEATPAAGGNNHELPGENPVIPTDVPPGFEVHFEQWERMRAMEMTTATFEDWLKSFGVKPPAKFDVEELYRPELLRYIREWQYPSNTVDPLTGNTASAVSWGIAERLDKDRYFKEPGFLFGVTVTRPKVYMGRQYAAAAHMMQDAYSWLPAVLQDQPYTSLKESSSSTGPLAHPSAQVGGSPTGDYWVDLRDLAIHGDQFISVGALPANMDYANDTLTKLTGAVGLPTPGLQKRFVDAGAVNNLFVDITRQKVRVDGVFQPTIHSRITDTSL